MKMIIGNIPDGMSGQFLEMVGEPREALISNVYPIHIELSGEKAYVFYAKVREVKAADVFALITGGLK